MMYDEIKPIGLITVKSVTDFILGNTLTASAVIFLNQADFDELALQYRETTGQGISMPFYLEDVKVEEDTSGEVPQGEIGFLRVDKRAEE